MKTKFLSIILLFSSFLKAQYLEQYIQEAFDNNSNLELLDLRYHMDLEAIKDADNLEDTQLGLAYFLQAIETRVGPQRLKLSARQSIPWFGTLQTRKATAQALANISKQKPQVLKNELELAVKMNYFKIYEQKKQLDIFYKQLEILKYYKKITTNQLVYSKSKPANVLKIKIEMNKINTIIQKAIVNWESSLKTFNLLLNRKIDSPIEFPDKLEIENNIVLNQQKNHPKIEQIELQKQWLNKSLIQNEKEAKPKLNFGLDYAIVQQREVSIIDNGKDAIVPMLGLKVPLFSNKYKTKNKVLNLKIEALDLEKQQLITNLKIAYEKHFNAQKQAILEYKSQDDNWKQTQQMTEFILASYQNSRSQFTDLIDAQEDALKYNLKKLQALINYHLEQAFLENLSL